VNDRRQVDARRERRASLEGRSTMRALNAGELRGHARVECGGGAMDGNGHRHAHEG